jgi:hypothetical protein
MGGAPTSGGPAATGGVATTGGAACGGAKVFTFGVVVLHPEESAVSEAATVALRTSFRMASVPSGEGSTGKARVKKACSSKNV